MKKSIQLKLISGILIIILLFLLGIIFYSFSFKHYFQYKKSLEMQRIVFKINDFLVRDSSDVNLQKQLSDISDTYSVEINVEKDSQSIYSSYSGGKNYGKMAHNKFQTIKSVNLKNGLTEETIYDKSTGVNFLSVTNSSQNMKYKIILRAPVSIIDDAASKSVSLLLIIFTPVTLLIIILTLIFARRFTKPIIEITDATARISRLDFTSYLHVKSDDEVGLLANSVNYLAEKISNDLNELKDKNEKLNIMIEKEHEEENYRREFISSVSHELKSPISVISGYAQMLSQGIITSEEDVKYYIDIINEESERMSVIVSDLLDFYKLQSANFKLEIETISLKKLIDNIIVKNKLKFHNNNIKLFTDIDDINVECDKIRIEQIIQNYINNAVSHADINKIVSITAKFKKNSITISVYNSGENIADEYMQSIWKGFVRADKARNYKEKRVGLGLAIVSRITALHEGLCGAINKENGVEFYVELKKNFKLSQN